MVAGQGAFKAPAGSSGGSNGVNRSWGEMPERSEGRGGLVFGAEPLGEAPGRGVVPGGPTPQAAAPPYSLTAVRSYLPPHKVVRSKTGGFGISLPNRYLKGPK